MSLQHYDRFLFRCDPGYPEHALLKNGVIVRRPKEDHFERIVEVDCTVKEATALLNLAKQLIPPSFRISKKLSPRRVTPKIRIPLISIER